MSKRQSPVSLRPQPPLRPPASKGALPADAIQKAWECFSRGERGGAEAQCRSILGAQPDHAGALTLLGILTAQSGRTKEAVMLLGLAAARLPNEASAHQNYGSALRDAGRLPEALQSYSRAIELAPGNAEVHYNRAV